MSESERQYEYIAKCHDWLIKQEKELGRKLTVCIQTLGCQMNAKDSEKILAVLEEIGYVATEQPVADIVLFNTCTVRENANLKVYGRLGYLKKQKENHPHMKIILCGCMMQEDTVIEKIRKSYRFVDLIFGTHNIYKLAELLYEQIESGDMVIDIWKEAKEIVENLPSDRKFSFKAGVNIMYGCNNFCSYCIVPYVRGRERSREPEDIIREIEELVKQGVKEVMLLGQNVNSYGKTLSNPVSFAELLHRVEQIEGLHWIRFMTSHPKDLSDELINVMKNSTKICRHLHLPVQSGSSRILKEMNRKYTREDYLALVNKIKMAMPDIALTTDVIVGFPGETEKDVEDTITLMEQVGYESAYTFIYSKRTGTPAASLANHVPEDENKKRFAMLLKHVQQMSRTQMERREGQIHEAMVEEVNTQLDGYVTGRLSSNAIVHFQAEKNKIGQFVNVKLTECKGFYYMGEMID